MFEEAVTLDLIDPLKEFRKQFVLPENKTYFCSNSLGLPAKNSIILMEKTMKKWGNQGAEAWFSDNDAWYDSLKSDIYQNLSIILGARESEVVVMNSLTINLHLLLTSFYRPTGSRFKIIIPKPIFPSDLYALKSHIRLHGFDPELALISVQADEIEQVINENADQIALVFLSAVNYLTGQILDIKHLTSVAQNHGCIVGVDIAHAAGNIPLHLHDYQVDFAVGCSYKYLCSGPGGPGIAFVHSSHHQKNFFRLSGWWGNDPKTRFQMDKLREFIPFGGAASWQVSTPAILNLQPLIAALKLFVSAGMANLRKKSILQTEFLLKALDDEFEVITPLAATERGNQISIKLTQSAAKVTQLLHHNGFICDFRPPNILRVASSPLYNSFQDIYNFVFNGLKKEGVMAA